MRQRKATGILLLTCVGCAGEAGQESYDAIQEGVINGTTTNAPHPGVIKFNTGVGTCSGTLVRNRAVLTAKHCLHPQGLVDQTGGFSPWSSMSVTTPDGATTVNLTGYTWWNDTEVAILYLASDIFMPAEANGHYGQFVSLWHGTHAELITNLGICWGFGFNAATQAQCNANHIGTGLGTARSFWQHASTVNSAKIGYLGNSSNQNFAAGDSGGSCYALPLGSWQTQFHAIGPLGWFGDGTCKSYNGQWGAVRLDTPHPSFYRDTYRSTLTTITTATNEPFTTNVLSAFVPEASPGISGNWSWSSAGELIQSNNSSITSGGVIDGNLAILDQRPMGDGFVGAKIYSSDDDVGGVVGRWRTIDSYYRVGFDEQRKIGQLLKRTQGTFQVLATYTLPASFDWSTPHDVGIGMRGTSLWGYLDGSWVMSAVDSTGDIIDGYCGIVSAALAPTHVDQFWTVNWP